MSITFINFVFYWKFIYLLWNHIKNMFERDVQKNVPNCDNT